MSRYQNDRWNNEVNRNHWRRDSERYFDGDRDSRRDGPSTNGQTFSSNPRTYYDDNFSRPPRISDTMNTYGGGNHFPPAVVSSHYSMDSNRDSIFARLDQGHVMDRLGPESYENDSLSMPPVPLFHSSESHSLMIDHPLPNDRSMVGWGNDTLINSSHGHVRPLPGDFFNRQDFGGDSSCLLGNRGHAPPFDIMRTPYGVDRERHSSIVGVPLAHGEPLFNSPETHDELHYNAGHTDNILPNMLRGRSPSQDGTFLTRNRSPSMQDSLWRQLPVEHHNNTFPHIHRSPPRRHGSPSHRHRSPSHRHRSPPRRHKSPPSLRNRSSTSSQRHRSPPSIRQRSPPDRHKSSPVRHRSPLVRHRFSPVRNRFSPVRNRSSPARHGSPLQLSKSLQRHSINRSPPRNRSLQRDLSPRLRPSIQRERPVVPTRPLSSNRVSQKDKPTGGNLPLSNKRSPSSSSTKRSPRTYNVSPRMECTKTNSSIESDMLPYQIREVIKNEKRFQGPSTNDMISSLSIRTPSSEFISNSIYHPILEPLSNLDMSKDIVPISTSSVQQIERDDECNHQTQHRKDDTFESLSESVRDCEGKVDYPLHDQPSNSFPTGPPVTFGEYADWSNQCQDTVISSSEGLLFNDQLLVPPVDDDLDKQEFDSPCSTPRLTIDCDNDTTEDSCSVVTVVVSEDNTMEDKNNETVKETHHDSPQGPLERIVVDEEGPSNNLEDRSVIVASQGLRDQSVEEKDTPPGDNHSLSMVTETLNEQSSLVEQKGIVGSQSEVDHRLKVKVDENNDSEMRPESPESGEIVSDEEKEDGEIVEVSDGEKDTDHNKQPEIRKELGDDESIEKYTDVIRYHQRPYPMAHRSSAGNELSRVSHRNRRWSTRHYQHKTSRYDPDGRRKRHKSTTPKAEDEEKELLLLRNAALETMIVRPRQSPSKESSPSKQPSPSKEPSPSKQPSPLKETTNKDILDNDEWTTKDIVMEVDMDIVSSDSCPSSRDRTPDVSNIKVAAPDISKPFPSQPHNSSIKVVTNKNTTWKIPSFKIVSTETDEDDDEKDIYRVIEMYRKVAETKVSDEQSVSVMMGELKECDEEIEEEEMKLQLLQEQLKVSQGKLVKLKVNKVEQERKINAKSSKLEQSTNLKVPSHNNSRHPSPTRDHNDKQSTDDQSMAFEDISQSSSVTHSPTPSNDVDRASDSDCRSENETSKIKVSPLTKEITSVTNSTTIKVSGSPSNKKKHLLNLVTARQNNLEQVKGLLAMLENNQRKRKKSPNSAQTSSNKKISQGKTKSFTVHKHHLANNTKNKLNRIKSKTDSVVSGSKTNEKIESGSDSQSALSEVETSDKKSVPLQDSVQGFDFIKDTIVKEWFDHMTSSDVTSDINMPRPPQIFSAVAIVVNHFDKSVNNDIDKNTTDPVLITDSLNKAFGNSNNTTISINHLSPNYESPLLKFRSYRLSPLYRTLSKKPLSSLTHSNTINHDVIMCHHESQGTCINKSCKAQHFNDVIMCHHDIINDLTQYLPSDKAASVRDTISTTFSKLEMEQLQTMAAHIVYKELSHDDHVTISSQWLQSTVQKPTNKLEKLKQNNLDSITEIAEATNDIENKSEPDSFRYFVATKPAIEATPTSIINKARQSADTGLIMIEKGIGMFPHDEALWIEYIRLSHRTKKSSETDFNKAVSTVPHYSVYFEVIKLAMDKEKWILRALKHFLSIEDSSCSQIVLELILSYCNWYIITKDTQHVLELLKFSKDISETNVMSKLSIQDKTYLGLVHLHLMYTHTLPPITGCTDCCVPVRMKSKKNFLIPFKHKKLPKDSFDKIMALFRCYIKRLTMSSCDVPGNVANCLPLYINLFYFEVSQGNSQTTLISVSRLLNVVPNVRELLVFRSTLDLLYNIPKGADPLLYYMKARNKLSEGENIDNVVSLLTDCVCNYFVISDSTGNIDPCILYRKLLGYQVPYDLVLPPVNNELTPPDHTSLCLNYCLLAELTTPTLCADVYESTLHHGTVLWLQYINLLAYRIKTKPSPQLFKQLIDISQRFSLAVSSSINYNTPLLGQSVQYTDYTTHNQMLDVLLNCVHSHDNKIKLLKLIPMYHNPYWIYRFHQFSDSIDEIRTILANYLFKFPFNIDLWLIAISLEMRLGNFRQARWMFSKASQSVPYSKKLWSQFLLFELAGIVNQYSNFSLIQSIFDKLSVLGVEFKSSILNLIKS